MGGIDSSGDRAVATTVADPARRPLRIAFYGELGHGNLGNDGSLAEMVRIVGDLDPDAELFLYGNDPGRLHAAFGLPAFPANIYGRRVDSLPRLARLPTRLISKTLDFARTVKHLRGLDIVIVPGAGVFEGEFGTRPSELPYAFLRLGVVGRVLGTRVAYVAVGASTVNERFSRLWFAIAARIAHYRSFRDDYSKRSLRAIGGACGSDSVFTDVVFGCQRPEPITMVDDLVAVGVQIYRGSSHLPAEQDLVHARYLDELISFTRWLVQAGYRVRLVGGHPQDGDVARVIVEGTADLAAPGQVEFAPAESLGELMQRLSDVSIVVASRYHNLVCAQLLEKPVVSISYGPKSDALLAEVSDEPLSVPIESMRAEVLQEKFHVARAIATDLRERTARANDRRFDLLAAQQRELGERVVLRGRRRRRAPRGRRR